MLMFYCFVSGLTGSLIAGIVVAGIFVFIITVLGLFTIYR